MSHEIANKMPEAAQNSHFEYSFEDGELNRLHSGIVRTRNALRLMKFVGFGIQD
jgi:hypothetical protein